MDQDSAEIARLRHEIVQLHQDIATLHHERRYHESQIAELRHQIQQIIDAVPDWIFAKDLNHRFQLVNRSYGEALNLSIEQILGKDDLELGFPRSQVLGDGQGQPGFWEADDQVITTGQPLITPQDHWEYQGSTHIFDIIKQPLHDTTGTITGVIAFIRDVTERVQQEQAQLHLQQQIIEMQAATLEELSTPLLAVSEGIVVMPLIGTMDARRAHRMIETLLQGLAERQAQVAVLDVTGVSVVDATVANLLLQAAQAVRLLGAHVVLTGIRPEVAQTLIGLGIDLSGIRTSQNLQTGIGLAMQLHNGHYL